MDDEEDENDAYRRTPPRSDCDESNEEIHYERWRRGSGELKIRQVFESIQEFKEAVTEYALKEGRNIKFSRLGRIKSKAMCAVEKGEIPCSWRIYCSFEPHTGQWMVKTFQDEHTCFKDGHCKILTDSVIANLFLNDLRNDPSVKPKWMQDQIQERYNVDASYNKCRKGKKKALDMIQDEYDEQYSRIKEYETEIYESNPDSTTDLRTIDGGGGLERFDKFYVCFAALRKSWLAHCRPIFGVDECFLKSTTKGQLLTTVGRDVNNQIFPIAWTVVHSETTETWMWFIQKLKEDLKLGNGDGFTLISDRQKAVNQELPLVEHRMCARHIYGNIKKSFLKLGKMITLFWEVVESYNVADYEASLAAMKKYHTGLYEAFMMRNPQNFCRACFKTTSCCEDALNNFSESYNSAIEKARPLPLIQMLETIRRQTMVRISLRKLKCGKHNSKFSPKVGQMISHEEDERKWCRTTPGPTCYFEVSERGTSYKVNMKDRKCSYRRWDLSGVPCRHALRVVMDVKKYKTDDLVSEWYLTSKWKHQYGDSISPVSGLKFWKKCDETELEAPPREISKGRKKNPEKRKKGINEFPTKGKKVTGHGRTMHCYRCGQAGHNSTKCKNSGVPFKPRPPKKAKTKSSSEVPTTLIITLGEGPTQTQPSQS